MSSSSFIKERSNRCIIRLLLLLVVLAITTISCPSSSSCCFVAAFAAPKQKKKTSSHNRTGGGSGFGFGSSSSSRSSPSTSSSSSKTPTKQRQQDGLGLLKPTAKDLLKKYNNNVDLASEEYFQQQMAMMDMNTNMNTAENEQNDDENVDDGDKDKDDDWGDTVLSDIQDQERKRHQKHIEKVKAAWDTVALFLPVDYERTNKQTKKNLIMMKKNEESYVDRRMKCIIHSCCCYDNKNSVATTTTTTVPNGNSDGHDDDDDDKVESFSLLDVGCGDGAILDYLFPPPPSTTSETTTKAKAKGNKYKTNNSQKQTNQHQQQQHLQSQSDNSNSYQSVRYVGVDVSTEMIDLGRRRFPSYADRLIVGEFPDRLLDDDVIDADPTNNNNNNSDVKKKFDTILFNGSFQFFEDPRGVLRETVRRFLKLQRGSRIVLSHVEGSKFVRHEVQTSQGVAVRTMPNRSTLEEYASTLSQSLLFELAEVGNTRSATSTSTSTNNNDDDDSSDSSEGCMKFKVMTKDEMLDGFEHYDVKKDGSDEVFYLVALEIF